MALASSEANGSFPPIADIRANADCVLMGDYYRQTYVFERVSRSIAIRYACYEDLRTGKFGVSGGDILRSPEHAETLSFQTVQEVDGFIERLPSKWFDTLLEAIEDIAPIFDEERST